MQRPDLPATRVTRTTAQRLRQGGRPPALSGCRASLPLLMAGLLLLTTTACELPFQAGSLDDELGATAPAGDFGDAGAPDGYGATSSMTFQVRTAPSGGEYAPRNIGAIWIEDARGEWVRTLEVWSREGASVYLETYQRCGELDRLDAVTSATFNQHETHTATWDLTDAKGNRVPDGTYTVKIETTDKHSQGPTYEARFSTRQATTLFPESTPYFLDMQLTVE